MKYPKLWPVGGHAEGEAKVRQLQKIGPKWLRASGPGWVAEKQGQQSNVKHGLGYQFYSFGWGRMRNPAATDEASRLWRWGTDPLYDEFWKERTRWSSGPTSSFTAGPHSPGEYLGNGQACDVRSTAPLDGFGNNAMVLAETKLSAVIDYLPDVGGQPAATYGGYEALHSTNVSLHGVGATRGDGINIDGFTPTSVAPVLGGKAVVVGYSKHGLTSPDITGDPEMLSPSFIVVEKTPGETVSTTPTAIPVSSMPDPTIGREWLYLKAVAVGPDAVCVVMQSNRRTPFTDLKTLDPRHQTVVAFTLDGGASWSNYTLTDLIEPMSVYTPRAIGIDYTYPEVHSMFDLAPEYENHPAYGKVIYEKIGDEIEFYVDGLCALPARADELGGKVYRALLISRSKAIELTATGGTQIGTRPTNARLYPFGAVSGLRVVGYRLTGLAGTNWLISREASNDGGVTWEDTMPVAAVGGLPDDLDASEVYWLGPMTAVSPSMLVSTMVVGSRTEGFYYRFVSVYSRDGGDTWQFGGNITPNTPEWISAAGPVQYADQGFAYMFHRAAAYDKGGQSSGRYVWLGGQFGKIHYCGSNTGWAPYNAAIPNLLQEVP